MEGTARGAEGPETPAVSPAEGVPVSGSNFAFTPSQLHSLVNEKVASNFLAIGGLRGLCAGLHTDPKAGIDIDEPGLDSATTQHHGLDTAGPDRTPHSDLPSRRPSNPSSSSTIADILHHEHRDRLTGTLTERRRVFGENRLPKPKRTSIWGLMWFALNDKLMFLLAVSATISLILGISQQVVLGNSMGSNTGWAQSAAIIGAIVITVTATAANDYQKNYKFERLQQRADERWVTAIRSGRSCHISIFDIVVGDVLLIDTGDVLPADGVLIEASQVLCDESHLSGESELVRKLPADQYDGNSAASPFVFSGAIVSQGIGTYVVTAVGMNLTSGRIMMALHNHNQRTPLQQRLGSLAKRIIVISSIIGAVYFFILFVRWLVQLNSPNGPKTSRQKGESFLDIFMIAATVIVIGVPEGLSLAVSVALAFATTRMLRDNNLVRLLRSCEVMGNATSICTDKTGTLTTNRMTVVAGLIGCDEKFATPTSSPSDGSVDSGRGSPISASQLTPQLALDVRALLRSSIVLNSTAFEQGGSGSGSFGGSSTEIALLQFAREHLGMGSLAEQRRNAEIVELFPFDTDRKYMAVVIRWGDKYRLLVKGAPEIIISNCSMGLESTTRNWNPREELISKSLNLEKRVELEDAVYDHACRRFRTIAMAYRDLDTWPPTPSSASQEDPSDLNVVFDQAFCQQMTFVALFAIRDPLRPEVVDSIRQCQDAGVFVRMVTGDNLTTAEAVALESGIFTAGGIAMDGPTFRRLTPKQMDAVIPRLQVLARSTADDKAQLVVALKRLGETVAVTGDGTNDAFALKAADVGFSMGMSGTQVAKDASSIVLLDDNFASIVKAVSWGRGITDATKKYCQFQFTLNITAVIITVISTLVGDVDSSVFNVVQLLWLNLILDILAGLALSTDYPRPYLMRRKPEPRRASLISITMWKMILGQSIYQLAVIFTLQYAGSRLWSEASDDQAETVVFNAYMFIQLFNQINCLRVDNGINIFDGIFENLWFIGIQALTFLGQILIVFKGSNVFGTQPLTGAQWGWSVLFGLLVIPIGVGIRCVPDRWMMLVVHRVEPLARHITRGVRHLFRGKVDHVRPQRRGADVEAAIGNNDLVEQSRRRHWLARMFRTTGKRTPELESSTDLILGTLEQRRGSTAEDQEPFDVYSAVEASKNGMTDEAVEGLNVHPDTARDDPVLMPRAQILKLGSHPLPPSQDWDVMRYIGIHRQHGRA